jgi:hypothetical protein
MERKYGEIFKRCEIMEMLQKEFCKEMLKRRRTTATGAADSEFGKQSSRKKLISVLRYWG